MQLKIAESLALSLMELHGLKNWAFKFDSAKRRFGQCNYTSKIISLSAPLVELNEFKEVRNTILHEIAHALVEPKHGHDHVWKRKALEIGCDGSRCYDSTVVKPKKKYRGECKNCHRFIFRHKRTQISCGKCSSRYNPDHAFIWTLNR